ncbi:MAG: cupin domain-containing protein [Chloroflexi bacterium]|nr:cupin domain-containing protein [Chloroflexota bacterium]
MAATFQAEAVRETIKAGRTRYLTYTHDLMMVVMDFSDGPCDLPDPPHSHPHEQITYVAEGELVFFLGDTPHQLQAGDMIAIPANVPHTIQLLTPKVRLIDTFSPIREDFLKG